MTFVWIDPDGYRLELDSPASIEAEAEAVARDIDRFVGLLENPDRMIRDPARNAINALQLKLTRLHGDLARWNTHAVAVTEREAVTLVRYIDELPANLADVLLVVDLHDEQQQMLDATSATPDIRARSLASPMTVIQRRAITACASRNPPVEPTRGEAMAWLDNQPRYARSLAIDGGWFAWIDRRGHAHRLIDPLAIEREVAAIAVELAAVQPALASTGAADTLYATVHEAFTLFERLQSLQGNLERFEREAQARDLHACKTFAADWRSKRRK